MQWKPMCDKLSVNWFFGLWSGLLVLWVSVNYGFIIPPYMESHRSFIKPSTVVLPDQTKHNYFNLSVLGQRGDNC